MPRPSKAKQRRGQVLDAFEACIEARGLDGSSLEVVAQAAGLTRQLLLHYFGSREALIEAAILRVMARYRDRIERRLASFAEKERLEAFLDWIFVGDDFCEPSSDAMLVELRARARRDPVARRAMHDTYDALASLIADEIRRALPSARPAAARDTAHLLTALCLGSWDLAALGFDGRRRETARRAAADLLAGLSPAGGAPRPP